MQYFKHEKLKEHLYRIIDITGVCCYLVVGEEKACLLDTCGGIGNIKEYVETITDKPIMVVLTHGHLDHIGGASLFEEVYMPHEDMPVLKMHNDFEFRVNDTLKHDPTGKVRREDFTPDITGEIKNIKDNDTIDLGGVTIKMIQVKGHTPGIICPFINEDRTIIFGDACGVGVLLFDEYSSNVSEYRQSLIKLKAYEGLYDTIYRNHGTFFSEKVLLDNVIECCDKILAGKDAHQEVETHGYKLFSANKIENHKRVDGKEGNILYALDKVK
ncbi:MAG: MBL fold metallo-hydrolase [Clostridium sp.]|uniref:MBL fold metallo-hydrolase n=1 Tax=Clostridium TaxID=1485 RepID=UPI0029024572|nr:MBL fold metallo-hydrolase [Clostridium sp.]MDU1584273.1 MBL fold metallo-hydrolase [Clostridium sp.]MDU1977319.1 MBL fold metallo-hydrolase [Clostridium sp.]MDU1993534.1 MBL fold metallo-hydrolase [Clostridium sp.]MDU6047596.1 MBL fold metallo-hydrolase [Clostridium sp.]MDU6221686.1 MBL fold metallo-hydrolase [Clostridium sp.]